MRFGWPTPLHDVIRGVLTALAVCCAQQAFAVPPAAVSITARIVCEYRALAAQHPDRKLRNKDALAGKLCEPVMLPREYEAARDVMDVDPEAYAGFFYVNARTQHIDGFLAKAASSGIMQVVVLGAGFDSRAYRFHKAYPTMEFFEIDLPATIGAKQSAVMRLFGALPKHVHYVPMDFDTQTLESALPAAGYDSKRKTLFILEGVSMYVNEAGNNNTFEFIRHHSPSRSLVVYDYLLRQVVEGNYEGMYAASKEAEGVARIGEPFVTGWTPPQAAEYARQHGLSVLEDLDSDSLTRRYLTGTGGKPDGRIPNWYRIIDARVQ